MTLRFIEGFDDDQGNQGKWDLWPATGTALELSSGRTQKGLRLFNNASAGLSKTITATSTVIVGAAINFGSAGVADAGIDNISLREGTTTHLNIRFQGTANTLQVRRSTTVLATAPFLRGVFNYLEIKATIHDTTGSVVVKVNGVEVVNLTNTDTRNAGTTGLVDNVAFGGNSASVSQIWLDDLYIADTSGTVNNDFLGDVRVQTLFPTADATPEQWALSTGTDSFALIDETPPSGTDYISSDTAAEVTMVEVGDITDIGQNVYGVQPSFWAQRDTSGTRNVRNRIDSNASIATGTDKTPINGTYRTFFDVFETDPDGGGAWTVAKVNALRAGVEARN